MHSNVPQLKVSTNATYESHNRAKAKPDPGGFHADCDARSPLDRCILSRAGKPYGVLIVAPTQIAYWTGVPWRPRDGSNGGSAVAVDCAIVEVAAFGTRCFESHPGVPACPRFPTLTDTHSDTDTMGFRATRLDEVIVVVVCGAVALLRDWRDLSCCHGRYDNSGVAWEMTARVLTL